MATYLSHGKLLVAWLRRATHGSCGSATWGQTRQHHAAVADPKNLPPNAPPAANSNARCVLRSDLLGLSRDPSVTWVFGLNRHFLGPRHTPYAGSTPRCGDQPKKPSAAKRSARGELKRAVCFAVRFAWFEPRSFGDMGIRFEPTFFRTASHTLP